MLVLRPLLSLHFARPSSLYGFVSCSSSSTLGIARPFPLYGFFRLPVSCFSSYTICIARPVPLYGSCVELFRAHLPPPFALLGRFHFTVIAFVGFVLIFLNDLHC